MKRLALSMAASLAAMSLASAQSTYDVGGTVLNRSSLTDLLPALGRITAHWSALYNVWVVW